MTECDLESNLMCFQDSEVCVVLVDSHNRVELLLRYLCCWPVLIRLIREKKKMLQ
jgi:hypothetical protein